MDFTLKSSRGSKRNRKRVGRGPGSGLGCTSGRGNKGQKARSGGKGSPYMGFEGGQMPLYRRTPKRGFTNIFRKDIEIINISQLNQFNDGDEINIDVLIQKRLVKRNATNVKLLGNGDLSKKLKIKLNMASKSALEKVQKVGASFESVLK